MIKNYLTTAFRNFVQHKTFTLLNILGLAIGIASSLLILQYVKYERSFDTFHTKAQDIYRIQYNSWQNGELNFECAAAVPAVGPEMKNNFPEVQQFTRLYPVSGVITYEDPVRGPISFREENMQITDTAVFEVFDFELIAGDPVASLRGPNKVVISEYAANKYFGEEDPIGKSINWDGDNQFEVTGVMSNVPDNSHIKFDFFFSYQTLNDNSENASETNWGWYDFNTYVLLEQGTDPVVFQSKWDEHLAEVRSEDWEKYNYKQAFILQPLLEIHLNSNLLQESLPEEQGDSNAVYFLTVIAFFILVIAWVNYVNLSTAKSFERANEVGVRKVMGAHKGQLRNQFLAESFLINFIAVLIGIGLVLIFWPTFSALTGRNIPFTLVKDLSFWAVAGGLFVVGSLLSGFYPAWVLSSFQPVVVLKGKVNGTSQGSLMRKGLVVFQFFASIVLISGTLIVSEQLRFMRNQDLGINIHQTFVLEGPGVTDSLYEQNLESFKTEALRISGIESMTASSNVPGNEIFWTRGIRRVSGGPESSLVVYNVGIDDDYVPSFNLELVSGRNFSRDNVSDQEGVLINRSLAMSIDYKNPEDAIGEKVRLGGDTLEILGVLEDYHQMSLKNKKVPLVFRLSNSSRFYAFKIQEDNYANVIKGLKEPWDTFFPGNPYDYFFLDDFFNRQYKSDSQFSQVFGLFSVLAIFVACMGLFGLASFMTSMRTKEVGIRKALGSSVQSVALLLSSGFIQLVLIGSIFAVPVAWFVMNSWLDSFPYRITINPLIFLFASVLVIIIAFVSVGYQTIKSALANPATTLRYE